MLRRILFMACALSLLLSGLGTVNAALVGPVVNNSGLPGIIIPPTISVLDAGFGSDNNQLGFDEQQNVTLLAPLAVDNNSNIANGGTIAAGTIVNSHMIFLNNAPGAPTSLSAVNDWQFDGQILGVMSNSNGSLEVNSSGILGVPGTTYPNLQFNARGMEGNVTNGSGDFYTLIGMNTLRVGMGVTEPGDWIRVVTAPVPVPSAMLLFGTGLIGLIAFKRFKK